MGVPAQPDSACMCVHVFVYMYVHVCVCVSAAWEVPQGGIQWGPPLPHSRFFGNSKPTALVSRQKQGL